MFLLCFILFILFIFLSHPVSDRPYLGWQTDQNNTLKCRIKYLIKDIDYKMLKNIKYNKAAKRGGGLKSTTIIYQSFDLCWNIAWDDKCEWGKNKLFLETWKDMEISVLVFQTEVVDCFNFAFFILEEESWCRSDGYHKSRRSTAVSENSLKISANFGELETSTPFMPVHWTKMYEVY